MYPVIMSSIYIMPVLGLLLDVPEKGPAFPFGANSIQIDIPNTGCAKLYAWVGYLVFVVLRCHLSGDSFAVFHLLVAQSHCCTQVWHVWQVTTGLHTHCTFRTLFCSDDYNDGFSDEEERVLTREELLRKTNQKVRKLLVLAWTQPPPPTSCASASIDVVTFLFRMQWT